MTMFDLTGRVAIVTGGNGGIGLGMARGLAAAGASVVVAARDAAKAKGALAQLGGHSAFIPLDVGDETSCRAAITQTSDRFGRLDILVNNAGTSIRKPPETYTAAEWHAVLDTNLTGAFLCSQAAHPIMKRGGGGKVINIGSMFALFGSAYAAPYAASKGALVQLTKSLAAAWGRQHPGQRRPARVDRHRADPRCTPAGRGSARKGAGPHPGWPLGRSRRPRRNRRLSRLGRVGFHHRRRDPGGWRLFGDGLASEPHSVSL